MNELAVSVGNDHIDRSDGGADWQIEQKSNDYILFVRDADCWYQAQVKRDGCIDFNRYYNTPFDLSEPGDDNVDSIHICELDEMIERLTKLRDIAKIHFGSEWPQL